jgi:hypothetical protein
MQCVWCTWLSNGTAKLWLGLADMSRACCLCMHALRGPPHNVLFLCLCLWDVSGAFFLLNDLAMEQKKAL